MKNHSKSFKERTILGRLTLNLKPGAGKEDLEKALKRARNSIWGLVGMREGNHLYLSLT